MKSSWNTIDPHKIGFLTYLISFSKKVSLKQKNFNFFKTFWSIKFVAHEIQFFIKDFFRKYDQIHRQMQIWSHLLKNSLIEKFLFVQFKINLLTRPYQTFWNQFTELLNRTYQTFWQFFTMYSRNRLTGFFFFKKNSLIFKVGL